MEDNTVDINSHLADAALKHIQPSVVSLYEFYGLNVTLTVLSLLIARGISYSEGLTDKEKAIRLKTVKDTITKSFTYYMEDREEDLLTP